MRKVLNSKWEVLVMAMIVCSGFTSCGDDNNETSSSQSPAPSDTRAIDLGLSVCWAQMNVGANSPKECGLFFAWGETRGYDSNIRDGHQFDYNEYKWMTAGKASAYWINKYQVADYYIQGCWFNSNRTFIGDGKAKLDLEDDAASVNWGGSWRMPTIEECKELINNCSAEWVCQDDVYGCKLTSTKNGNSIFLPASGVRASGGALIWESNCLFWSSSLKTTLGGYGFQCSLSNGNSAYIVVSDYSRNTGMNIRPVMVK